MKQIHKSSEFDIPYNREELANYLGVERSALSKELSDLQKQGFITYHKSHFKLNTK
jgi:Mn-dependent DtxR family transcriptional regulator